MPKWKTAFQKSLDPEARDANAFIFGAPASAADLLALEQQIGAKIPADLRSLLEEFNGTQTSHGETYFFPASQMLTAADYYRDWDWPTDLLLECSKSILYVCQENGMSEMWGVAFKPFGPFKAGQIVAFDHDQIAFAEKPEQLFVSPYERLMDLVETRFKEAS